MKFTIKQSALSQVLNVVQRSIAVKSALTILEGIKLSATSNELILTGSDSNLSILAVLKVNDPSLGLTIETPGEIVLKARFFNDIVRKLPGDLVTFSTNNDFVATIVSDQAQFSINGLNPENYPYLPQLNSDEAITLKGFTLKQIIGQTIVSVFKQESRPILTGIKFTLGPSQLKAVSTDAHRLSQRILRLTEENTPENELTEEVSVVVPSKSLMELVRTVEDDDDISIVIKDNRILFETGRYSIYSRLLEGNYPDTDRLLPKGAKTQLILNSQMMIQAAERVSLLAQHDEDHAVQLTIDENKVVFSSREQEIGEVTEELDVISISGEPLVISFNPAFIKDALKTFNGADVVLNFTEADRPFYIVERENESEETIENSFIHLITPIRTQA
ncbi:DNA polymerase III subunit beta [Atopobacter phocae]|uniref:DNA polymerase III subunit beta n=1 Tax=Atopobacter phocae TaxID=136492 RepID=UPI00046EE07C|nr:DNA polymerase III subunit beta [Atopobacter phocae]